MLGSGDGGRKLWESVGVGAFAKYTFDEWTGRDIRALVLGRFWERKIRHASHSAFTLLDSRWIMGRQIKSPPMPLVLPLAFYRRYFSLFLTMGPSSVHFSPVQFSWALSLSLILASKRGKSKWYGHHLTVFSSCVYTLHTRAQTTGRWQAFSNTKHNNKYKEEKKSQ